MFNTATKEAPGIVFAVNGMVQGGWRNCDRVDLFLIKLIYKADSQSGKRL